MQNPLDAGAQGTGARAARGPEARAAALLVLLVRNPALSLARVAVLARTLPEPRLPRGPLPAHAASALARCRATGSGEADLQAWQTLLSALPVPEPVAERALALARGATAPPPRLPELHQALQAYQPRWGMGAVGVLDGPDGQEGTRIKWPSHIDHAAANEIIREAADLCPGSLLVPWGRKLDPLPCPILEVRTLGEARSAWAPGANPDTAPPFPEGALSRRICHALWGSAPGSGQAEPAHRRLPLRRRCLLGTLALLGPGLPFGLVPAVAARVAALFGEADRAESDLQALGQAGLLVDGAVPSAHRGSALQDLFQRLSAPELQRLSAPEFQRLSAPELQRLTAPEPQPALSEVPSLWLDLACAGGFGAESELDADYVADPAARARALRLCRAALLAAGGETSATVRARMSALTEAAAMASAHPLPLLRERAQHAPSGRRGHLRTAWELLLAEPPPTAWPDRLELLTLALATARDQGALPRELPPEWPSYKGALVAHVARELTESIEIVCPTPLARPGPVPAFSESERWADFRDKQQAAIEILESLGQAGDWLAAWLLGQALRLAHGPKPPTPEAWQDRADRIEYICHLARAFVSTGDRPAPLDSTVYQRWGDTFWDRADWLDGLRQPPAVAVRRALRWDAWHCWNMGAETVPLGTLAGDAAGCVVRIAAAARWSLAEDAPEGFGPQNPWPRLAGRLDTGALKRGLGSPLVRYLPASLMGSASALSGEVGTASAKRPKMAPTSR